ncbi:peptidase inhibitor 16-like [Corythoichthys intestinalis]|uniref:peptidase inhibitor 16-like n=1 Tax=Corythoichthys intestinalis TaxID=161448 RepID=UPI0025A61AA4|nr:peptidase inhibitor 16-like [Corythoichthys intestinalis]XP_057685542.1 peptidase inhibitor 16-like [Corythoichthys intestinalis]
MQHKGTLALHEVRRMGRSDSSVGLGALLRAWLLLALLLAPGAWSSLTEEGEELLVELHNHYRGQVSPTASAMLPLKWDPTLKVLAEGYAAKCIWNHNPDLEDTGENLYASTGTLDLRAAMEKWFLEHLNYDFQNNSCDEDKMCGHYTQMVWSDTHAVGCAVHQCSTMEGLDWEKISFLVCNYYPAGNYDNERPYSPGDWCSRCPEELQTCENNLCVPEKDVGEEVEEEEEEEEEREEDGMILLSAATTESFHQADITMSSSTTPWPLSPSLHPLVTVKPDLPLAEQEENILAIPPSTAESYHQVDTISSSSSIATTTTTTSSKTILPLQTSVPAQRKAAVKKDSKVGQQEVWTNGLPVNKISREDRPFMTISATSPLSPQLMLIPVLCFIFIIFIALPL